MLHPHGGSTQLRDEPHCLNNGYREGQLSSKHTEYEPTRLILTSEQRIILGRFLISQTAFYGSRKLRKSERFVAIFGRKLSSITLFVHARYGARKVLCTGLVECGGVLVIPENVATSWKEFPGAKTFRAAHTCRSRQRRAGDGVYGWVSIKTS